MLADSGTRGYLGVDAIFRAGGDGDARASEFQLALARLVDVALDQRRRQPVLSVALVPRANHRPRLSLRSQPAKK